MKEFKGGKKKQGGWAALAGLAVSAFQGAQANKNAKRATKGSENGTLDEKRSTVDRGNTLNLTMEDQNLLRALSGDVKGTAGQFSRQNAITDSEDFINSAMRELREKGIPEILKGQIESGGYGSVTSGLLANDAAARASEAVGRARIDAVTQYGGVQAQNNQLAGQLLEVLKGANVQTYNTKSDTVNQKTSGSSVGTGPRTTSNVVDPQALGQLVNGLFKDRSTPNAGGAQAVPDFQLNAGGTFSNSNNDIFGSLTGGT